MTQVYEQASVGMPLNMTLPIEEIQPAQKKRKKTISQ